MSNLEFISVLKRMDSLITNRSTGAPENFASRLRLSERTLFNYLSVMKALGAPIVYSRQLESYLYSAEGRFIFEFKKLSGSEYAFR